METNSPLNIFITGGASGAAREATRQAVARGHKVTVLTTGSDGAAKARQDGALPAYSDPTRAGELKSLFKMSSIDVVIHLLPQAGNSFPVKDGYEANEREMVQSAVALTEAAEDAGVKFIVYTSYAFLYGDSHGEWLTEDGGGHGSRAFRPGLAAEHQIKSSSVPSCILRAGFVYGGETTAISSLGEGIRRGRSPYLVDSHNIHNWIYEADLASAAVLAAEKQPTGEIITVVDDEPTSANTFAGYLATAQGMTAPGNSSVPAFALNRATSDMQRLLLTTSARLKNDKAKQVLGWTPRYPNYKLGLEQTLLQWRAAEPTTA
ncbi:MAG: NAD(P)-dependent oxidoreductase [Chloroflexi bacterium]|nr:NAD(P)-dependent oxidoreductase [Chloroflexota bacterium]MCC6895012.1 NAD(P)-dependent oxidoreductase [Anaerolineae bacterium]